MSGYTYNARAYAARAQNTAETRARVQKVASEEAGKRASEGRGRSRKEIEERLKLCKQFVLQSILTNGRLKGKLIKIDEDSAILVMRILGSGRRETWNPEFATLVSPPARGNG